MKCCKRIKKKKKRKRRERNQMFNQMLFGWLDFVHCVYIIWRRTIKSLDKFTRFWSVCPHLWQNKRAKFTFPESREKPTRIVFTHTFWLLISSAQTFGPGSSRSFCMQSLSALWSLRFIHSRVHLWGAAAPFRSCDEVFKSPSCPGKVWLRRLNGKTNELSPLIGSSVGDQAAESLTGGESLVQSWARH